MLGLSLWESIGPELQELARSIVQGNGTPGARVGLALTNANGPLRKINLEPAEEPQF